MELVPVSYFRGEKTSSWELQPSVMRDHDGRGFTLRAKESEMLNELMSRQPSLFDGLRAGLAQWVLGQHHGLRTRLLDVTRNPLVALFHACEEDAHQTTDGKFHVFAAPRPLIKPFNSDTIRVIANFAKLSREEQNVLLGKTAVDVEGDFLLDEADEYFAGNLMGAYSFAQRHLYALIREEKPYYEERIDPRNFFAVYVVEPQQSFPRIRAQSGAFLVSAFP